MKIAIPEYRNRVSPVFDSSQRLLLFEIRENEEQECREENWSSLPPVRRAERLQELRVDILLCGGISAWLSERVVAQGIKLVSWLAGDVREVLTAYLEGQLPDPRWAMPGCCGHRWRGGWDRYIEGVSTPTRNGPVRSGAGMESTGKRGRPRGAMKAGHRGGLGKGRRQMSEQSQSKSPGHGGVYEPQKNQE